MSLPLVSVVCICYNHEKFVQEAVLSVLSQTYQNIELLIIDDASTDKSWEVICELKHQYPQLIVERNVRNEGNCMSFNKMLAQAKGKYCIDLASDDVCLPQRIEKQVEFFESLPEDYGVVYSNALYINETGKILRNHFYDTVKRKPVEGEVFSELLAHYIICPPTMMMKSSMLKELEGYDPSLAYEDFDFWVRSSRKWKYGYQDMLLTKKRELNTSLSSMFGEARYQKMHQTTVKVCQKATKLMEGEKEKKALSKRVNAELRAAIRRKDSQSVNAYKTILKTCRLSKDWKTRITMLMKR